MRNPIPRPQTVEAERVNYCFLLMKSRISAAFTLTMATTRDFRQTGGPGDLDHMI
jgi:hypothetical protein